MFEIFKKKVEESKSEESNEAEPLDNKELDPVVNNSFSNSTLTTISGSTITACIPPPSYTVAVGSSNQQSSGHGTFITTGGYGITNGLYLGYPPRDSALTIYSNDASQTELVKLNLDGSVVWANGIKIDEAAKAFSTMLSNSVELRVGITESVKRKIRDNVFSEIIALVKEKGSVTADDLSFMLESSKIMEKLKGFDE